MLYFSEVKGKTVTTEDGITVGTLQDLIFLAEDQPTLTKLVIERTGSKLIIPVKYLIKINHVITLAKQYETTELAENELYVMRNLLDKQIIDLQGNKIVRVNDVVIQDKPVLYIAGVDIGWIGILRWLRLEKVVISFFQTFGQRVTSDFLSWGDIQPLELTRGRVQLKKEESKLEKIPPEDLADHLEKTNIVNIRKILTLLDKEYAAEVISNLNLNYQTAIFRQLPIEDIEKIIRYMDPDDAVDVLLTFSPKKREHVLSLLDEHTQKKLHHLLNLSTTDIGEMLTSEYLTVLPKNTVHEVVDIIKKSTTDYSFLTYIYVLNENNQLVGVFNLHEVLLQPADMSVYKFMTQNVVVIHMTTPREIAIKKMLKYKLFALPVIDREKQVLGIITFDDVAEHILKKI